MPVFETDDDRTYFLTTIPVHPDFLISPETGNEHRNEYRNENRNGTIITGLTNHERLVLDAIEQDRTVTIRDMAAHLGISKSSVSRAVKSLREKQMIGRSGSNKKGVWKILAQQ